MTASISSRSSVSRSSSAFGDGVELVAVGLEQRARPLVLLADDRAHLVVDLLGGLSE
jgi:hypothetical protein